MKSLLTFFLLVAVFLTSQSVLAKKHPDKKKEDVGNPPASLGSSLLLIGTSSAQTVDKILKGIESLGRRTEQLSSQERNFLFGYANYRLGRWEDAEGFFKKCDSYAVPADHLLFYRAQAALGLKEFERAADFFADLVENHGGSVWALESRIGFAKALISLSRFEQARQNLEYYLKSTQLRQEAFEANLLMVRSYMEEGDKSETALRLQSLVVNVSDEIELVKAEGLVKEADKRLGTDLIRWMNDGDTQFEIADSLMKNMQWNDAILHLRLALEGKTLSYENRSDAKWLYARAHFRAHLYKEVIPLFEDMLKDGGGGLRLTLLQHLASGYARVDDYEHAILLRRKIMREYEHNPSVVLDSSSKIAFLLVDDGLYREAINAWEDVLRIKRGKSQRITALWYLAWSHYKLKEYETAVARFTALLKDRSSQKIKDRIMYWKAQSLEHMGRKEEARQLYREILGDHPLGYYGVLAKRRLEGDQRGFDDFALTSLAKPRREKKAPYHISIGKIMPSAPHISRAVFFDHLDLHEEAARELRAALAEKTDPDIILKLAAGNFAHDVAYQLVYQRYVSILHSMPARSDGFERFVWEMSYPEAYKPVVERLAGKNPDPRLVYAIMRAESNFRPAVVSPAGAVGLMQLMPVTAQKMAKELSNKVFDTRDLYKPAKNIEYGISYLKKLNSLFPNNHVAVIAAYNAGEEAVGRWLGHGYSQDVEEFIEEIPYDETNLYVKKVMMSYWILQQLYTH